MSGQLKPTSRLDVNLSVTSIHPRDNKVKLSNGKEYTYKALVVNNGLDSQAQFIDGLHECEFDNGLNQVYVHKIDDK